jgi:hypothetical protein
MGTSLMQLWTFKVSAFRPYASPCVVLYNPFHSPFNFWQFFARPLTGEGRYFSAGADIRDIAISRSRFISYVLLV